MIEYLGCMVVVHDFALNSVWMRSCQGMGVEKVHKDDMACTFEFLFRFNRVWINSRLLLLLLYNALASGDFMKIWLKSFGQIMRIFC